MTWGHHVAETIRKAKTARGRLYPLLCGDSRLNLRNKLLLIKSVIQPQLTYASTAWGHACNTHLRRIQAVENIALRTATSAPWFVRNRDLYRDLEWTPVQEVIKVKAAKVYAKATDHENPLLRAAVDYEPDRAATHKRPKQQLLDSGPKAREVRQVNYIGEISLEAQQLIRDRPAARRRALRSEAPEHRRKANQLSRRVRAALDEHRQETWRRLVEPLNPRDNSVWKTQKALRIRRRPFPPLHDEQGIVHTNRDKAEAFADSLELQCRENQIDDEDEEHTALVERRAGQIGQTPDDEETHPMTPEG
ncbi:hypothetical protein NQ315_001376 [Exocentrus adspersus]|uniref:Reverse transcriptase n=1 Tax=Exocentrus adspersus TaxID=1586481 RepID=A0AAV8WGI6_9CUCU|nr:hypothetical protein NQ315_001376 [Exocentrus adspersus]